MHEMWLDKVSNPHILSCNCIHGFTVKQPSHQLGSSFVHARIADGFKQLTQYYSSSGSVEKCSCTRQSQYMPAFGEIQCPIAGL